MSKETLNDQCILLADPVRIQAVRDTRLIGTPPEESIDRLVKLSARLLKAPISIFSLIGENSQYFKSAYNLPAPFGPGMEIEIDNSVCQYTLKGEPLPITDIRENDIFRANPAVAALNLVSYLGVPVKDREGNILGALCTIDHVPRTWKDEEVEVLQELADSIMTEIELRNVLHKVEEERTYHADQSLLLEMLAKGEDLNHILEELILKVEKWRPGVKGSVLLYDQSQNKLFHAAAPSLPDFYNEAINGVSAGEGVGCCGTAAFTNEQVVVENIPDHEYWKNYRELAERANLRSCWSEPIHNRNGEVIGTFAMYYDHPRRPTLHDKELIVKAAHIAGVAIERYFFDLKLQDSDERFDQMLKTLPQLLWGTDSHGNLEFVNSHFLSYTGLNYEDLKGRGWLVTVHPDDLERTKKTWEDALKQESEYHIEYRLKGSNGEYEWHLGLGHPIRDSEGKTIRWYGSCTNIQKQKEIQLEKMKLIEQLDFEKARLEAVLVHMPAGLIVADANGEITLKNSNVDKILGELALDESKLAPLYKTLFKGELLNEQEIELSKFDGSRCVLSCSSAPVRNEKGDILGGVVIFSDITERKKNERYITTINSISEKLSTTLELNDIYAEICKVGVKSLAHGCAIDILQGDSVQTVAVAHRDPEIEELIYNFRRKFPIGPHSPLPAGKVLRERKPIVWNGKNEDLLKFDFGKEEIDSIQRMNLKGVLSVPIIVREKVVGSITLYSSHDSLVFCERDFSLATEFARRAGMAIENARLYEKATTAVSIRNDFISIASHELKTPLTSLILQTQIARKKLDNLGSGLDRPSSEKLLSTLGVQLRRLGKLVDDMLDVTRLNTGKLSVIKEHMSLSLLLNDITKRFMGEFTEANIRLRTSIENNIEGSWDAHRIEQVISNLFSNACKYAPHSDLAICLFNKGKDAWLTVSDNGPGLDSDNLKKIFNRFERAHDNKGISGLGLGLYIAKQIIEEHDGELMAEGGPGKGLTFTIRLPR